MLCSKNSRIRGFLSLPFIFILLVTVSLWLSSCTKRGTPSPPASNGQDTAVNQPEPPQDQLPRDLEGLLLVSIGNNAGARPQSGLSQAAIVFEAPAEGGISRLLAGFTTEVSKIGPVRSARKCLVQIAVGFGTPFGHCGGSQDSYEIIRHENTESLDEIYTAGECFWRTQDRSAPDNLYTSTQKLLEGAQKRGFTLGKLPFLYGDIAYGNQGNDATKVEFNFSKLKDYPNLVSYEYQNGTYIRSINGVPHKDGDDTLISPKNLVFMEVQTQYPKGKAIEVDMNVEGQGDALFFSAGKVIQGTWRKPSLHEPLEFLMDGKPFTFQKGMIWVHLVPDLSQVKYQAPGK